ncbi:hypothetical protein HHI36_007622 [Cryptolaemus montrouzieri]|uniref:Uncharacterized protein n=1 Tax=Cryptolaemus montrouzieri TaxID=559131 RepID=A0ABD2MQ54_9CUCU
MSPEQTVNHQSKTKIIPSSRDDKNKKGIISKIKSSFSGTTDSDSMKIQNEQLRKQTKEFLDDTRKYDDVEREAWSKYKVIWLKDQTKNIEGNMKNKSTNMTEKPVVEEHDYKMYLLVLQKTNSFLEDHKDYHNKQRAEYNDFLQKAGIPERDIWISTKMKEKKNIITKVKNLLSPQQRLKPKDSEEDKIQQFLKDQSEEFLRKHQYLIHKEEVDFKKLPLSTKSVINEETIVSQTITKEEVVPQKKEIFKEHPIKEGKQKKSTFSKIKSLMSGTKNTDSVTLVAEKENELLKEKTREFLNNLRKYDDQEKNIWSKTKIIWLNENKICNSYKRECSPTEINEDSSVDNYFGYDISNFIKEQNISFLQNHQDYHNKQKDEHNVFLHKMKKPDHEIWLSSKTKESRNIITKVKNLLSPKQSHKRKPPKTEENNIYLKKQTDEFLRQHQYLIHRDETEFKADPAVQKIDTQKIIVKEKSPMHTTGIKCSTNNQTFNLDPKINSSIAIELFSNEQDHNKFLLILQQTDSFLKNHKNYHNQQRMEDIAFLKKAGREKHEIWLASKEKSVKETVMSKVKNIFHSPKPVPESAIFYDDIDETEKHLQDQQNKIEPSNLNNSTKANNILTPELDLTKVVHTTRKKSPNMDETETPKKKANNSLKNTEKQNESQKNRLDRDIISHQQNPQVSKKKVTFIEEQSSQNSQTYDDDIANYQILMQQTKQFLQDHKYYHDQQREQPINEKKTEENLQNKASFPIKKLSHSSTCSKNVNTSSKKNSTPTMIKEAPTIPPRKIKLTSQTIYSDSDMNRSKIINSDEYMRADDKNMFELTKGQTKQFLQEHQYVIHKEEISQNKMKPTPFPRKSERTVTSSKHDLDKAGKTDNEDYALRRENLVLFLKNHQDYHDKERNEFIDFATEKVKNPKGVTEKSPTSEPKSKSTFMTKLKSFVSGSSQNSSPDKDWKRENDLLRKQTLEFLISQKCYNDLEGAANLNFVNMSKLLKPQSRSIDSKNTGGFNFSRKRLEEESPKKMVEEGQNTNPQVSSINEKKVQKEIATNVNSISKIIELDNSVSIRKQNQDFLDSQIHYINSENNTWKNYVKFRPEVAVLKKTYPQNEKVHSTKKVYIKPQTNTQIRKPSSQVESEKIDYEILLHKTKTFLEDSQNYTSLQHREFIEFVPKALPPVKTDMESKTEERKDGVLSKIKSFLPSSQSKNKSYDLLKAKQSSQTDSKPTETMPTLKKISQPIDIQDASNSHEVTLKEQTDLFLKDHQDYHDKQRTAIMQHFGNYEDYSAKQNKSKKGIMHKFISLVGGEQSKKKVSKKSADNNHSQKEEVKKPDESFDRKQIFEVRELDASPTTYKKMRFPPKEDQEVETVSESEKLEKMASENNSENVTKVKEDSVSLNSTVTTSILSESSRCNLHEKTSHGLQTSAVNTTLDTKQKIVFEDSRKASISKDSTITKLSDVQPHINHNERKNYVKAKIQTQDFLLSQKRFCDSNYIEIDASESQKIITKPPISEKLSIRSSRIANNTEKNPMNTTEEDLKTKKQESKKEPRKSLLLPSAPTLHQIEGSDKRNESVLIQRVVSPLSPKKTIFKEIRSRESSPDRRIYILSEGYTITKEPKPNFDKFNNYTERNGSELHPSETSRQMKNRKPANQDSENQEHFQYKPEISFEKNQEEQKKEMKKFEENLVITEPNDSKLFLDGERDHAMMQTKTDELLTEHSEGQNCSSRSEFLPSPSQHSSQGDSVRIRQTKRRTYREMENEPLSVITETRIEINGSNTQRYTTSCYFHQVPTPVWYTESLLIDMEEKSQKLNEKVYYDNKFRPTHWSETYLTDVIPKTDMFTSEVTIPILHESEAIHYISLEPQQKKTEELENV